MKTRGHALWIAACLLAVGCSSGSRSSSSSRATPGATPGGGTTVGGGTPGGGSSGGGGGSGGTGGVTGEFQRNYLGRDYWLYVPDSYNASQAAPVAVFFHGAGDTGSNFYNTMKGSGWLTAARQETVILVVPDTKSPFSDFASWSGNPNNDHAAMRAELNEVLDLVQSDVASRYNVDTASVHALGFSNGGGFLGVAGLPHNGLATVSVFGFGYGAVYPSGTPPPDKRPVHMVCGTRDNFFTAADQSQAFFTAQGHDVLWEPVSGVGHLFSGLSTAIGPASALAWMTARSLGSGSGGSSGGGSTSAGSGGTGGALGRSTRTIQVPSPAGAFTYTYEVYVSASYDPATPTPMMLASNMGLTSWTPVANQDTLIVVDFRPFTPPGFDYTRDVDALNAVITDVQGAYNVDLKRRYYHGYSAGAHWGYALILASADNFAGLGIHAGSLGEAVRLGIWPNNVPRRIAVAITHGAQDGVVPVGEGRLAQSQLQQGGHPVAYQESPQGTHVGPTNAETQFVWNFLKTHSLP